MKQRILKDRLNSHSDPVWGNKGVKLVLCFSCISPVSQAVTVSCTFLLASLMGHHPPAESSSVCLAAVCHLCRLLLFLLLVKMEMCLSVITIQLPLSWDICSTCILPPAGTHLLTSVGWPQAGSVEDVKLEKLWDLSSGDIILNFQFRVSLPSSCASPESWQMPQGRTHSSAAGY